MPSTHVQRWAWRITALFLWLTPPLLASGVHHGAMDALLYCTGFLNDGFVDHPGLYGFWAAIVYIQLATLSGWAVLHSKRPWRLWAVLASGGLVNLLVRRDLSADLIRYEPNAVSALLGLAAAHGDSVVAVRLVWMWLIVRELFKEGKVRRGLSLLLCAHPVILGLGARWWDTGVVVTSLCLYLSAQWLREIRPLPKADQEAVLGGQPQRAPTSSQFSLSDREVTPDHRDGDDSDDDDALPGGLPLHDEDDNDGKQEEDGPEDVTLQ